MNDLPRELWEHIAHYLSDKELWHLRGAHPVLREIALERHFKTLSLDLRKIEGQLGALALLGERYISPRIHKLVLSTMPQPYPLTALRHSEPSILSQTATSWGSWFLDVLGFQFKPTSKYLTTFENVKEVHLYLKAYSRLRVPVEDDEPALRELSLVTSVLGAHRSNITTISFQVSERCLSTLLASLSSSVFPHLESLAVTFGVEYELSASDFRRNLQGNLIPFIDRHRQKIATLSFITSRDHKHRNLFILSDLPKLPILSRVKLFFNLDSHAAGEATQHFLQKHGESLESLRLSLVGKSPYYDVDSPYFGLIRKTLPNLEHLEIDSTSASGDIYNDAQNHLLSTLSVACASEHRMTLSKLRLRDESMEWRHVEELLTTCWPRLRFLDLELFACPSELFGLLEMNTPCLEEFTLILHKFIGKDKFLAGDRQYLRSRLQHITLLFSGSFHSQNMIFATTIACFKAILHAFPRLILANNVFKDTCLKLLCQLEEGTLDDSERRRFLHDHE